MNLRKNLVPTCGHGVIWKKNYPDFTEEFDHICILGGVKKKEIHDYSF